jgi:hypothetical protein
MNPTLGCSMGSNNLFTVANTDDGRSTGVGSSREPPAFKFFSLLRTIRQNRVAFGVSVKAAPLQAPYRSSLPQLRFPLPFDICPK